MAGLVGVVVRSLGEEWRVQVGAGEHGVGGAAADAVQVEGLRARELVLVLDGEGGAWAFACGEGARVAGAGEVLRPWRVRALGPGDRVEIAAPGGAHVTLALEDAEDEPATPPPNPETQVVPHSDGEDEGADEEDQVADLHTVPIVEGDEEEQGTASGHARKETRPPRTQPVAPSDPSAEDDVMLDAGGGSGGDGDGDSVDLYGHGDDAGEQDAAMRDTVVLAALLRELDVEELPPGMTTAKALASEAALRETKVKLALVPNEQLLDLIAGKGVDPDRLESAKTALRDRDPLRHEEQQVRARVVLEFLEAFEGAIRDGAVARVVADARAPSSPASRQRPQPTQRSTQPPTQPSQSAEAEQSSRSSSSTAREADRAEASAKAARKPKPAAAEQRSARARGLDDVMGSTSQEQEQQSVATPGPKKDGCSTTDKAPAAADKAEASREPREGAETQPASSGTGRQRKLRGGSLQAAPEARPAATGKRPRGRAGAGAGAGAAASEPPVADGSTSASEEPAPAPVAKRQRGKVVPEPLVAGDETAASDEPTTHTQPAGEAQSVKRRDSRSSGDQATQPALASRRSTRGRGGEGGEEDEGEAAAPAAAVAAAALGLRDQSRSVASTGVSEEADRDKIKQLAEVVSKLQVYVEGYSGHKEVDFNAGDLSYLVLKGDFKRTQKMLEALAKPRGPQIVTLAWVAESTKKRVLSSHHAYVPSVSYTSQVTGKTKALSAILSLRDQRSDGVLTGMNIVLDPSLVTLQRAFENAGATIVSNVAGQEKESSFAVAADDESETFINKWHDKGVRVVKKDLLLDMIMLCFTAPSAADIKSYSIVRPARAARKSR
jgi:hypothetical protein